MIEPISVLSIPLLGVASWVLSAQSPERVRQFAQILVCAAGVVWGGLVATGIEWQPSSIASLIHESLGHLLAPLVAVATGVCVGWWVHRDFRCHPFRSVAWFLLFLVVLAASLSNERTGYLGETHTEFRHSLGLTEIPWSLEQKIRFNVLHRMAVPVLLGALLAPWVYKVARLGGRG